MAEIADVAERSSHLTRVRPQDSLDDDGFIVEEDEDEDDDEARARRAERQAKRDERRRNKSKRMAGAAGRVTEVMARLYDHETMTAYFQTDEDERIRSVSHPLQHNDHLAPWAEPLPPAGRLACAPSDAVKCV